MDYSHALDSQDPEIRNQISTSITYQVLIPNGGYAIGSVIKVMQS